MKDKLYGTFVSTHRNDKVFDIDDLTVNRDNACHPYWTLREKLRSLGIELSTIDVIREKGVESSFALFNDFRPSLYQTQERERTYILLFETPLIHTENENPFKHKRIDEIFTWRKDLGVEKVTPINFSNKITIPEISGWQGRESFSCIISGNKTTVNPDPRELYSERIKTVRWFEEYALNDFHLFGTGWDMPPMRYGKIGRAMTRLQGRTGKMIGIKFFPSYRGRVTSKLETLRKFKYSFCYENVTGYDGYITEKIFDCFFAGCVPIYWGAPDITVHIPENCFIDRTQFKSHEEMYSHLKTISEQEYIQYQKNIISFLESEAAHPFSAECFADVIANKIAADLGLNH